MSQVHTRPIGSKFLCNGVELEVVENTCGPDGYCGGQNFECYFDGHCDNKDFICRGTCSSYTRSDGKDVYFRRVKS